MTEQKRRRPGPGRPKLAVGERGVKATKEQGDFRRAEIRRALSRCEAVYNLVPRLSAEWGIKRRQVEKYIEQVRAAAAAEMSARGEDQRKADARELVDALKDIAAEARAKKDGKTATMALRELAKITGAYAPERHELTGAGGAPLAAPPVVDLTRLTDEDAEAFSRALARVVVRAPIAALPAAESPAGEPADASATKSGADTPGADGKEPA